VLKASIADHYEDNSRTDEINYALDIPANCWGGYQYSTYDVRLNIRTFEPLYFEARQIKMKNDLK
jgi:hypothetical protein